MSEIVLGLFCLLITAVAGVMSINGNTPTKRILRVLAVPSFMAGCVLLINGGLDKHAEKNRSELDKPSGALEPSRERTPDLIYNAVLAATNKVPLFRSAPTNEIAVFLGTNVVVSTSDSNFVVFRIYGSSLLSVSRSNNQLFISSEVRSEDGRFIAKIKNNEFHVNPVNHFYIERPNRSTLKVYEQTGGCVLDVNFLNPLAVRISGVFRTPGKESVIVTDGEVEFARIQLHGFAFHLRDMPLFDWPVPSIRGQAFWIFDEQDIPIMAVTESGGKIDAKFMMINHRAPIRIMTGDIEKCRMCGQYFDESLALSSNFHATPFPH